jgi:choline-sulfatase
MTPPNFLFLFPDQWRWDWLGCETSPYGKVPVRTPNIDDLAARGIRFTQCRTNSPLCAPARASLATGMRYHHCGVPDNGIDLDPARNTWMKCLRTQGYRVAVTGKPDLKKHGAWKGLDGWTETMGQLGFTEARQHAGKWDAVNSGAEKPQDYYMARLHREGLAETHVSDYRRRGQMRSEQKLIDPSPTPLPRQHYTDDVCGDAGLQFLQDWDTGSPWSLWVNFPGPHEPFDAPVELLHRYAGVNFPEPIEPGDDPNDHQALRRNYAAMIEGIDEWVGKLIAAVDARGELENTIIIFASDHGEMLGDHGKWYNCVPEEGSVHVPLIAAGPGISCGQVSDALVELTDLSATFLDLAEIPVPDDWDAQSLKPILTGVSTTHRAYQISELKEWKMIFNGTHKFIETEGRPSQLYNLVEDPEERINLINSLPEIAADLQQQLIRERERCGSFL